MHHELALPGVPHNFPIPPGFLSGLQRIASSMQWIVEYGADQINHHYDFEFGFCGSSPAERLDFWGIFSGETWLARLEVPWSIYDDDPTFVMPPDILFTAMLKSLAHAKPVRIVSRLQIVIQTEDQPGPGWLNHYELPLRGFPNQPVATLPLHRCGGYHCQSLVRYPDAVLCAACERQGEELFG
ncbi:hypothetical protein DFH06DRAFT_1137348 [Mycena polygramma]|nr:hypothetical protein DFH06DRAFT_1137348 [Mycena polygramma]